MIKHKLLPVVFLLIPLALGSCTEAKPPLSGEALEKMKLPSGLTPREGYGTQSEPVMEAEALSEGSGSRKTDHPAVTEEEKLYREVIVPENIKGKWKAVKILVKDKKNEERTEVRTVSLGSDFVIGEGKLKVTVGPFFPNFVMNKETYTSMSNQLINPAVQVVVEENGKIIYKGWAFKRFPTLYSFEHEDIGLQLLDSVPADVS